MSLLSRVKRLWELSGTSSEVPTSWRPVVGDGSETVEETVPTKRMATVVQDDPLDVFPPSNDEEEPEDQRADDAVD